MESLPREESEMKRVARFYWEPVLDRIRALSRWCDDGTSSAWWITEPLKGRGCTLYATKDLLPKPKKFETVLEAMMWAEQEDRRL